MSAKLFLQAIIKFLAGVVMVGALIFLPAWSFVLGSLFSFFIMLVYIPIIVVRILNEEKFLEKELNGYTEYKKKVKYRLIPFIW